MTSRDKHIKTLEAGLKIAYGKKKRYEALCQCLNMFLNYLKEPMKHDLNRIAQQIKNQYSHYLDDKTKENLKAIYKAIRQDSGTLIETELGGRNLDKPEQKETSREE